MRDAGQCLLLGLASGCIWLPAAAAISMPNAFIVPMGDGAVAWFIGLLPSCRLPARACSGTATSAFAAGWPLAAAFCTWQSRPTNVADGSQSCARS